MQNPQSWPHANVPFETGPDYVALVIEWEDVVEDDVTAVLERKSLVTPNLLRKIAMGAGAVGALLFAGWGVHRLRHA